MPPATVLRQSRTKIHDKIQELSWTPTYATPADKYPTDYTFEKAPKKDPMKQVLRSYFPMEEEKDQRVYGAIDGAIRGNMFSQVQQRWMEWQKLFLSLIPFAEISAARAMPLAINAAPNPEVHNGLAIQMIDEVRHSTIQMNLKRLYMNHYIDPAGFDLGQKAFANCYAGTIGRQFGEAFITGDAITAANIYLTHRRGDSVHEHAVRGHAIGGGGERRLPPADGISLGSVGRVAAHLEWLLDHP